MGCEAASQASGVSGYRRPNVFFTSGSHDDASNLFLGLLFTLFGLGGLAMMFFAGRTVYRSQPGAGDAAAKKIKLT